MQTLPGDAGHQTYLDSFWLKVLRRNLVPLVEVGRFVNKDGHDPVEPLSMSACVPGEENARQNAWTKQGRKEGEPCSSHLCLGVPTQWHSHTRQVSVATHGASMDTCDTLPHYRRVPHAAHCASPIRVTLVTWWLVHASPVPRTSWRHCSGRLTSEFRASPTPAVHDGTHPTVPTSPSEGGGRSSSSPMPIMYRILARIARCNSTRRPRSTRLPVPESWRDGRLPREVPIWGPTAAGDRASVKERLRTWCSVDEFDWDGVCCCCITGDM
jgi:hypothetical protein